MLHDCLGTGEDIDKIETKLAGKQQLVESTKQMDQHNGPELKTFFK